MRQFNLPATKNAPRAATEKSTTPLMPSAMIYTLLALLLAAPAALAAKGDNTVKIGAQFPIYKTSGSDYAEDGGGRRRRAAFLMALDHLNADSDNLWDNLLPDYTLSAYVYDSKRDSGHAVARQSMPLRSINACPSSSFHLTSHRGLPP